VNSTISILKGIHPGAFLERELKKRGLSKGHFAISIGELPQTLSPIFSGKRDMNTPLSLAIEEKLGLEEGFLMTLQLHYDIKKEKRRRTSDKHPDLLKFRPALFWDTKLEKIDWEHQKQAVIRRVFERGEFTEKKEIVGFYGSETIREALTSR